MTNIVAKVIILLVTNSPVEHPQPDGVHIRKLYPVIERHVVTYSWSGKQFVSTNDFEHLSLQKNFEVIRTQVGTNDDGSPVLKRSLKEIPVTDSTRILPPLPIPPR